MPEPFLSWLLLTLIVSAAVCVLILALTGNL